MILEQPKWWKHSSVVWDEICIFFCDFKSLSDPIVQQNEELLKETNWHLISSGLSNNSYCFSINQRKFFIQITNQSNNKFLPYERVINLKTIINDESYNRLSPWLVDTFFWSETVKIQQWFESDSLDLSLNRSEKNIELLAMFLADMHRITLIELPDFDLKRHIQRYHDIAVKRDHNKYLKREIDTCFNNASSKLETYRPVCLCHYDLNLNNILINKNVLTIKIIDWEYVCIGDPMLDVVSIINSFDLSKEHESYFISSYKKFIGKHSQRTSNFSDENVNDMKLLNGYINELWKFT